MLIVTMFTRQHILNWISLASQLLNFRGPSSTNSWSCSQPRCGQATCCEMHLLHQHRDVWVESTEFQFFPLDQTLLHKSCSSQADSIFQFVPLLSFSPNYWARCANHLFIEHTLMLHIIYTASRYSVWSLLRCWAWIRVSRSSTPLFFGLSGL